MVQRRLITQVCTQYLVLPKPSLQTPLGGRFVGLAAPMGVGLSKTTQYHEQVRPPFERECGHRIFFFLCDPPQISDLITSVARRMLTFEPTTRCIWRVFQITRLLNPDFEI